MSLTKKWEKILNHENFAPIKDNYRKQVTAILLENEEKALAEDRRMLTEATPTNNTSNITNFDPVLISLVRRAMPNLMAYDVCGVQPMNMPTGLIFAMKAKYGTGATGPLSSTEAGFDEANSSWSGTGTHQSTIGLNASGATGLLGTPGNAIALATAEGAEFNSMGYTIDRITVTAKTRQLKAEYSPEMAHDLKTVHNLDADSELSNLLTQEIMAEINREVMRSVYQIAKLGAQVGTTTAGAFDLDTDSDGRWSVERFKGLMYQVERDANTIARTTRRGRGNIIICSADAASALAMAGKLDYTPGISADLNVDETGNTFVGTLNGKYKVYVDPYFATTSTTYSDIMVIGYKGNSAYDAGMFYCPYVPLQKVTAVDPDTFVPKIGFKTRYGLVANPLGSASTGALTAQSSDYYRRFLVANLL